MKNYTAKFRIGDIQFEISGDTEREIFERATVFGEIPRQCGSCEGARLWPRHRIAQGKYHYYEVVCLECGYRCKVGQTQESGSLFCRGEWEPPYVPDTAPEDEGDQAYPEGGSQRPRRDTSRVRTHAPASVASQNHRPTYGAGKSYGQR